MGCLVQYCEKCGHLDYGTRFICIYNRITICEGGCVQNKQLVKKIAYEWDEIIKFRYLRKNVYYTDMDKFWKYCDRLEGGNVNSETYEYLKNCSY